MINKNVLFIWLMVVLSVVAMMWWEHPLWGLTFFVTGYFLPHFDNIKTNETDDIPLEKGLLLLWLGVVTSVTLLGGFLISLFYLLIMFIGVVLPYPKLYREE